MAEIGEDAHVLVAALFAKTETSSSQTRSKTSPLMSHPHLEIDVKTADQFLVQQWGRDPRLVASVIVEQSELSSRKGPADRILHRRACCRPWVASCRSSLVLVPDSQEFRDALGGR
jgi:hypothetical protein